jgi:peptidyl-tRNA hydrolase, PTH1 family
MKLIVGLGNPGKQYERTRHNLGFLVVDRLAAKHKIELPTKRCESLIGAWAYAGEEIILAKPQTFMNRSGSAVECLLRDYQGSMDDLVVIYDDLDLPFGRLRIRPSGSAGGHRGMLSITERMAGTSFKRVRMGIGRPSEGIDPVDYVLSPFNALEMDELSAIIDRAADAVTSLVRDGAEKAMACYNQAR